jgi:hypothetical protein
MQEVWTICRIFRRSISYKKHPQQQQVAGKVSTAGVAQPDYSSSITGSLESDTGDEYTNGSLPPPQAPAINSVNDAGYGYSSQQFQGQWNSSALHAAATAPLPSPTTMAAFHHDVLSSSPAAPDDMYYKDGSSWDDIGRMMMELTDDMFCDSRYA